MRRRISLAVGLSAAGLAVVLVTGRGALLLQRGAEHPVFYNTLTTNCTAMILAHAAVNSGSVPYSWKILLSGHAPEYAYERGRLDQSMSYEALRRVAHINAAAQAADQAPDFSQRIRAGRP